MEIHAPGKTIHSLKDFLLEIVTITVGILIALSLEAVLQSVHHRSLVREARANLLQELRTNRRELDKSVLKELPRMVKEQEDSLAFVDAVLERRKPVTTELRASYGIAELTSTSWATAQSTGAVGFMEFADVNRLATVYELQKRFADLQDRLVEGYVMAGPGSDPDKATPGELQQWKQRIVTIRAHLLAVGTIAGALLKEYDKTLATLAEP